MNRREFVMMGAATAALGVQGAARSPDDASGRDKRVPPRNPRPYSGLDWSKVVKVKTTSHGHAPNQWWVDQYLKRGFGLLTLSNYYPSAPWWPLSKMTENYWRLHHNHAVMVNGKRVRMRSRDYNKVVAWVNGTKAERKGLPLKGLPCYSVDVERREVYGKNGQVMKGRKACNSVLYRISRDNVRHTVTWNRLAYAALHGIDVMKIPKDIVVDYRDGDYVLTYQGDKTRPYMRSAPPSVAVSSWTRWTTASAR